MTTTRALVLSERRKSNMQAEVEPIAPDLPPAPQRVKKRIVVEVELPRNLVLPSDDGKNSYSFSYAAINTVKGEPVVSQHVVVTKALLARFRKGEFSARFHAEITDAAIELGDRA